MERDRQIQSYQKGQMAEKLLEAEREKEIAANYRKMAEEAKIRGDSNEFQAKTAKRTHQEGFLADQRREEAEKRRDRDFKAKIEAEELKKAEEERDKFYRRKDEFEREFVRRRIEVGKRQKEAGQWYEEHVVKARKAKEARDEAKLKAETAFEPIRTREKAELIDSIREANKKDTEKFIEERKRRKNLELELLNEEKSLDKRMAEMKLTEHLDRVDEGQRRLTEAREQLKAFWGLQNREKNRLEAEERRLRDAVVEKNVLENDRIDDEIDEFADKLILGQSSAGKITNPLDKVKHELSKRRRDSVVAAADSSGIRLYRQPKGGNPKEVYKPELARQRMSLTWDE